MVKDNKNSQIEGEKVEDLQQIPRNDNNNQDKWCFAWFANESQPKQGRARAAMLKRNKWGPRQTITISFLDGDPQVQEKVMTVAKKWVGPGMANLTFEFRKDTNNTNIRISFRFNGSWSMIGTSCLNETDLSKPTMNYGWLDKNSSDEDIARVVLHEFGHALGLTHEHMNPSPSGKIKWNRKRVIQDLSGPPNKWSDEVIEKNMFRTFKVQETNFTELDKKSIMMYPIPAAWTLNGSSVGLNTELSEVDKTFIRSQYP